MELSKWRKQNGYSLESLGIQIGLSKGRLSQLERGVDQWPTDQAIKVDRITRGQVPVRTLRPDLSDVRVIIPADAPSPEARA